MRSKFTAALFGFSLSLIAPVHAFDAAGLAVTTSGKAWAELHKANRKDGKLSIELRFLTRTSGYSGEVIYTDLAALPAAEVPHLTAGGRDYPLFLDAAGKPMAPDRAETSFNYDPEKNPRVGTWKAVFEAPPAEAGDVMLILPNVAPIGPLGIKDR
ncbi:MAG: hypothetical protein QM682_02330 [Paracoccus sp. (in: a-proteobacteria)]|uniref:hypothetical protein n=1 Tax=Paracoccus sp. TaxID=267 RepID=UPI0039E23A6F